MDWTVVATLLAEEHARPLAVVDGAGRIQLVNQAAEEALGGPRKAIVGRAYQEILAEPPSPERFRDALAGTLRRVHRDLRALDGRVLRATLDLAAVRRGETSCLLIIVQSIVPLGASPASVGVDFEYEISSAVHDFGRLLRLCPSNAVRDEGLRGGLCYQALSGLPAPCPDCPALRREGAWPRVTVRRPAARAGTYEVVTARPAGEGVLRVAVRQFTSAMVSGVLEARIEELADQARLSERERTALRYFVMGRQLADIATVLGISRRTVKYHQANILKKLGADSRLDLMRLIL